MYESVWDVVERIDGLEYVFLRKAELVRDDFGATDDWDILCADIEEICSALKAIPLCDSMPCYNYYVMVNQKKLLLDIRCIGDGYFDEAWEKNMLKSAVSKKKLKVLDDVNQKYSLLYHALIQKKDVGDYEEYIKKEFGLQNNRTNLGQLAEYMIGNGYKNTTPLDKGVYINECNKRELEEMLNGGNNKGFRCF